MQKASELGCHIVTRDDDFLRLISEREEHPGVVFITDFKSVKEIGLEIKEKDSANPRKYNSLYLKKSSSIREFEKNPFFREIRWFSNRFELGFAN